MLATFATAPWFSPGHGEVTEFIGSTVGCEGGAKRGVEFPPSTGACGPPPWPSGVEGFHEFVDVVGVDAEDSGVAAVGGKVAGCDAASEGFDPDPGALGCLVKGFEGPV